MKHLASYLTVVLLFGLLTVFLPGCGGGGDDCNGCGRLRVHFLTLYLKVMRPDTTPLTDATVLLDGVASSHRTLDFFDTVFDCGCSFEGFRYNWHTVDYEVDIPSGTNTHILRVRVSKPGWQSRSATFTVTTDQARYLLSHAAFVMQPLLGAGSAASAEAPDIVGELVPLPR